MIDSATLASQTPAQASQPDNVRKCPVLSGPTNLPEETNPSPYNQTTYAPNPSYPDQTSTGHQPSNPLQPEPQAAPILLEVPGKRE